jgi:L-ascorbate metabolism protein UlaG (beta-lactamase superfamily)
MFFRQVLHDDLACASYVIADRGEAAVVDPKWEIEDYLDLADEHDLRITHVLETHNHADHVSGHGRLAEATGATLHVSSAAEAEYEHERLDDGSELELGDVLIRAVSTPATAPSTSRSPWSIAAVATSRGCCSPATRSSSVRSAGPTSPSTPTRAPTACSARAGAC